MTVDSTNTPTAPANSADVDAAVPDAIARAHEWLAADSETGSEARAAEQLSAILRDPEGMRFTMDFVDRVARPTDDVAAAQALHKVTDGVSPSFLGSVDSALLTVGAKAGRIAPRLVMPAARARMRQLVSHLVLDVEGRTLRDRLDRAAEAGEQLNLNLLGELVLGEKEARDRTRRTIELIENPRVTYVSVKASSLCAQLQHWDHAGSLERLKERLRPVYRAAKAHGVFVNLDMEEYHDLELTVDLFTGLVDEPEFRDLTAGIVLQAYLPDSPAALERIADFARARHAAGGAPLKVRLVKGANLAMERVHAEVHGWPQAPYLTKPETDSNYYRLLDLALQPDLADALRVGVASHNLFTSALAWELADRRGVTRQLDAEMLQGMAPGQARAVREVFGTVILYTPVVRTEDFDVAVSYLVRRLEENADPENFLHSLFAPEGEGAMDGQEEVFARAVRSRWETPAGPRRRQDRTAESGRQAPRTGRFANEPDTDPALPANRAWALEALTAELPDAPEPVTDKEIVDAALAHGRTLGAAWGTRDVGKRAYVLEAVGDAVADARGRLIAAMTQEAGKTVDQADPEVSEAVDFCSYYAHSARRLAGPQAEFHPRTLTLVVPPWNFPVAIPVGGITAALAAGSAVVVKPAPQVTRCAAVLVEAVRTGLAAAGEDPDLVQLVMVPEDETGRHLISHADIDQVILTGASDTAALFRSWRPEMVLQAETSGKNALVITPFADPDLAVDDLVHSAFGHSGQKCSAASLAIVVGSDGPSERLIGQLVDATETLVVGPGTDPATTMNGLIEAPGEKLERGLTQLEEGERWLVEPEQLDEEGLFWRPGIRDNVRPGSWFHTHECFGPVLGIMRARDLDEAIDWQNATGFGLTGGIHSLDDDEVAHWMERVEVGNAYVNRGITGAIVERQPFGGWKNSSVGPGAKAGGPNYVAQLGDWSDADGELPVHEVDLQPAVAAELRRAAELVGDELSEADLNWLWRAAELDELAWRSEFGRAHDPAALAGEANVFRYRPVLEPVLVHVGAGAARRDVIRQRLAAARTQAPVVFADDSQVERVAGAVASQDSARVRCLGEVPELLRTTAAEHGAVVLDGPVLADGRRELLPYLLEQAVSVTTHRFGLHTDTGRVRADVLGAGRR